MSNQETRPPCPPFTLETAQIKTTGCEWSLAYAGYRDPAKVELAYTPDSIWRNRDHFLQGRDAIQEFLTKKWEKESNYKLRKELFAFTDNKATGQWWRTYGLEDWTFADNGLMRKRQMSGNDVKITEGERWFVDGVDVNTVDIAEKHW
ncbi:duf1348-domain protein [Fusarium tjaetaba]|uniref:Duf1348-domain protein n=1 Tax=Fusarium tjaetaba TaxID=1567544 RepID=A0A8H5W2U6_9HYPO|nr:duf1348-domain protein [Fusarium tjaetaba]KAF5644806.1 duf1348-domain protein [Fusarium tjaetaba]